MDLDLNEEQEMLRGMVRGVCSSYANLETVRELEDDPIGYPAELWKQMAELDLIGLMIPAEYGGSEMSALEGAVVYTELGRALAPSPHFVSAVMAAGVLLRAGTDEQKQAWLPRIVSGDAIVTTAWLEPGNGFGPRGVQARATRRRRRVRARRRRSGTCPSPGPRPRSSCWRVRATGDDRRRPLPRRPRGRGRQLEQQLTSASDTQYAGDARRRSGSRVGTHRRRRRRGGRHGTTTMLDGVIMLAAQAVGGARYTLEITVQYAKDREQFDKPLGAFQAIAHYLADAADHGRRRRDADVRGRVGPGERSVGRAARADGEALRLQDVPRRHRDGAAGVRRCRLHRRVRHPALLPAGQAAADLVVGRSCTRGDRRRSTVLDG